MQVLSIQTAASLLVLASSVQGRAHGHHAHLHHRRQMVQEGSDGSVFVPVSGGGSAPVVHETVHQTTAVQVTTTVGGSANTQVAGSVASTSSAVQASSAFTSSAAQVSSTSSSSVGGSASIISTSEVTSKPAKSTKSAASAAQTTGDLTVNIKNQYGTPLSILYGDNAGGPVAVGSPTNGVLTSTTQIVYPTEWAGRVTVGKGTNSAGSKIEGSYFGQANIDVSYVDGYTVPIVCSCSGTPISGCNLELFDENNSCPQMGDGDTCINTSSSQADGPAPAFFAPCKGAAYTYPNDNDADEGCQSHTIDCCIGTSCAAVDRQPKHNGTSTA